MLACSLRGMDHFGATRSVCGRFIFARGPGWKVFARTTLGLTLPHQAASFFSAQALSANSA